MTTTVVLGRDDYAKSPVEKIAYIRCVVEAFRDGATISAKRRRIYAAQALAYMDDIIGAIAASRIQGSEAPPLVNAGDIAAVRDFIRHSGGLPDEDTHEAAAIFLTRRLRGRLPDGAAPRAVEGAAFSDEQLLDAYVRACNTESELQDAELSPERIRQGIAATLRAALRRREPQ